MFGKCWSTDDAKQHVQLTSKCTDIWRYGGTRFPSAPFALWHESSEQRVGDKDPVKGLQFKNDLDEQYKYTWALYNETLIQTNGGASTVVCMDVDETAGIVLQGVAVRKDVKDSCMMNTTRLTLLPGNFT